MRHLNFPARMTRFRPLHWTRLAVAAALLLAAGCSRTATVETGNAEGILHLAINDEPQSLDPHLIVALSDFQVVAALFEGLTALDETTSRPVPAAAESWTTSADGLTWTFKLRDGLMWSDGEPITARTFRDSWTRALAPTIASEYAYALFPIKNAARFNAGELPDFVAVGVKAPDDLTLQIELEHPTSFLPSILTLPIAYPVPLHRIRRTGGIIDRANPWARPGTLIGNGPFQLVRWVPDQLLRTERNPHFRDAADVGLNGVVFYPMSNLNSQEAAFRAGQLHLTSDLPPTKITTYRDENSPVLRLDPFLQTMFIRFNTTRPPLTDPRVRRALTLAIDRDTLAARVLTGGQQPASSLTPPNTGGYTAAAHVEFDPAAARALLAEAGFPNGEGFPALEVISRPQATYQQVLEAVQQMWRRELGITVNIALKEQRVWLDDENSLNYDLSNAGWIGDYVDPFTFLSLFLSDSGNNATGWKNAAYDALLEQAARAPTEAARLAAYQEAEALLLAEAPITPLYYNTQAYLIRPEVKGWAPALLGVHRYQGVTLEP